MAKLKLVVDPTFAETVDVPVPGGEVAQIEVTFKHRTRDEMESLVRDEVKDMDDVALVQAVASGWDLDEPFEIKHIKTLTQNYHHAALAIWQCYLTSLAGHRTKN